MAWPSLCRYELSLAGNFTLPPIRHFIPLRLQKSPPATPPSSKSAPFFPSRYACRHRLTTMSCGLEFFLIISTSTDPALPPHWIIGTSRPILAFATRSDSSPIESQFTRSTANACLILFSSSSVLTVAERCLLLHPIQQIVKTIGLLLSPSKFRFDTNHSGRVLPPNFHISTLLHLKHQVNAHPAASTCLSSLPFCSLSVPSSALCMSSH